MTACIIGFPECREPASRLAGELDVAFHEAEVRSFPDGESLVRVPETAGTVLLYRSLDNPNAKLVELILAASTLRENGAQQIVLIAPYLAYMRQDIAFHPGEAVSQRVIGALIAERFDGLVTIDPHLHRIARLDEAVPGIPALALSAASVLASAIAEGERPLLVGPDSESRQWVQAIADPLSLDVLLGDKQRHGDRDVDISIAGVERAKGRAAVLVDDVISSGETLIAAARLLTDAGASSVEALATHCLADAQVLARMEAAGIARTRSTDTIQGPTACLPVAALLADAVRKQGWVAPEVASP
ncbi:MAG: ribose-phosphate diphosphokinase [Novosphingobium sp.]